MLEWAADYGVEAGMLRVEEQNLRSAAEVLERAFEISSEPDHRPGAGRVWSVCWHFAGLHRG